MAGWVMPVYVDNSSHRFGRMVMCHMLADSPDELHAMADRIGVARRHFQGDASTPHYDICKAKACPCCEAWRCHGH